MTEDRVLLRLRIRCLEKRIIKLNRYIQKQCPEISKTRYKWRGTRKPLKYDLQSIQLNNCKHNKNKPYCDSLKELEDAGRFEDKRRCEDTGSFEDKRRCEDTGSFEDKRRCEDTRSFEDKRRCELIENYLPRILIKYKIDLDYYFIKQGLTTGLKEICEWTRDSFYNKKISEYDKKYSFIECLTNLGLMSIFEDWLKKKGASFI
jgi:hypothetical protein